MLRLRQTLGSSYLANGEDVRAAKAALRTLGEYDPPGTSAAAPDITEWTDDALFDGLRNMQRKNGLQVDGVAKPRGPTETAINTALARQSTGGRRGAASARRSPPSSFGLSASVGTGYPNRSSDIMGTKRALAWAGYYPPGAAQSPSGDVDEPMREGLQAFQRDFGLTRDGIMHPGGETQTRLDEIVTPLILSSGGSIHEAVALSTNTAPLEAPSETPDPTTDETGEPPSQDGESEANCASIRARIASLESEIEVLTADVELLRTSPEESDRSMTWRYVELLEEFGDYSLEQPDLPRSALKPDGAASVGGALRRTRGLIIDMLEILRANPEIVARARYKALEVLRERLKQLKREQLDARIELRDAGCSAAE